MIMGLAAHACKKRKMSPATEEVINELRRTTEAQSRCILNQQSIIERLLLKLQEHGLNDSLTPQNLSSASIQANSLSTSKDIYRLGPNSVPITWSGRDRDLVPISTKGRNSKVMVLTDEMIDNWNVHLNTIIKYNKFVQELNEDQATMSFQEDIYQNPNTVWGTTEFGEAMADGVPDSTRRLRHTKSQERAQALQGEINNIADVLLSQQVKINRTMLTVLLHNNLREDDSDQQWLKDLAASKTAKYDNCIFDPTLPDESEDPDTEAEM